MSFSFSEDPHIQKALKDLEAKQNSMLQLITGWASINTSTYNLQGIEFLINKLKEDFACLQAPYKEHKLPPYTCLELNGNKKHIHLGKALSFSKRPKAPFRILFLGHLDTVFPKEGIFQKVEQLNDKILQGPGVADMKGGICILLEALKAFEKSSFSQKIGWDILLTPDEEIGSPSSLELIKSFSKENQLALIYEPTLPNGALVSSRKGSVNLSVFVKGQAAHSGRDFEKGKNAIESLAYFLFKLTQKQDHKQTTTINIGKISGGTANNVVAANALCQINIRSSKEEHLQKVLDKIKGISLDVSRKKNVEFLIHQDSYRPVKAIDEKMKTLMHTLNTCAKQIDIPIKWEKTGGVCDGNTVASLGLANIDTLGVIGNHIHTPQEYLLIDSLVGRSKLSYLFLIALTQTK